MPTSTPNSLRTSGSGSVIRPSPASAPFTSPSLRSRVSQAKARTSTDTQNGTSTKAVIHTRCRGEACSMT